jgi:type II secretory pathway pseudopilin PulG
MPHTNRPKTSPPNGFALVELLTVLVLTGFLSSVLLQTTLGLQRCLAHWETSARMRQTLSAALSQMSRDFRITGCNPIGDAASEGTAVLEDGGTAPEQVHIRMDKRGSRPGSPPDGDMEDPDESIVYQWDDKHQVLRRNHQPVAGRIVQNPWGGPVFRLEKDFSRGLLRMSVTTQTPEGSLSLSSAVCIRNAV